MAKKPNNKKPEENLENLLQDVMSPDEGRRLQEQFEQAVEMTKLSKYDFDRVHALLAECVVNDPGNVQFAEAMLKNLGRKHGNGKDSVGRQALPGKGRLEKALEDGDWKRVLHVGAGLLKHNPWDAGTLRAMAEVCEACNCPRVELLFLRHALDAASGDIDLNRHLAISLSRVERFDEAIECWERVEEAELDDSEAPRMITILTLKKARHQPSLSGRRGSEDESAESAPTDKATETEAGKRRKKKKEPRELVFTRRQQLEQAIANHPVDERNYLKLADFHLSEGRAFHAMQTLKKGQEVVSDPRILHRLEDVKMLRAKERVETAGQQAAEKGTSEAYEVVEKLRDESHQLELDIYKSRLERNPDDDETNFQLGVRLKQAGSLRESLDLLKAGLRVPECRAAASLEIGEILQRYHQFPKALQFYRQATQLAARDPNQTECRKRALYRAAALATTMKLSDTARQYLSELVKMDRNYRDARTRLDRL